MDIKKQIKLRTIFIRYLVIFCISTIFLIFLFIMLILNLQNLFSSISSSILLPANYAENELMKSKYKISTSKKVTNNIIPDLCKYAVYTKKGEPISGNLDLKTCKKAWKLLQNKQTDLASDLFYYYVKIPRKNEICIVQYSIVVQFTSSTLRKFLPVPAVLIGILFFLAFILELIILGHSFSKKLVKKMDILQNATRKIQNQDLDFYTKSSGIFEIDNILCSIDKMKEALKLSMKNQWDLEAQRQKQISALAHDIKTPLTIASGNAELLSETEETKEQKEYTNYIIDSTKDMQQYIKTLIEISKFESGYIIEKEQIDTQKYVTELYNHISALTSAKKIKAQIKTFNIPKTFTADSNLLQRAIMNVVSNACDYSKKNDEIIFYVEGTTNYINFVICDNGCGFSKDALTKAKQQFYMGDSSRNNKSHYGMGLYIADSITKQHDGKMKLYNSNITKGAEVRICIPINME
ncbi:HAMP domain-containing histidine kinase [Clostridium felsineum]|uniref:HAMP domain-containing sensor histidine kinase n=1 Tax=Clostridium felsineum TaxID=36839 RepID=UPI00214D558F|nr:HAMP domain-containing sensor histidine kinase [Clostridium felsineum]MCR3758634.1 HAMP domain-containing histidine kinase [Clostridium felsineum]